MMYDLAKVDNDVICILAYTIGAMTKENYSEEEIDKYIEQIREVKEDYDKVVDISNIMIDKCNERALPVM